MIKVTLPESDNIKLILQILQIAAPIIGGGIIAGIFARKNEVLKKKLERIQAEENARRQYEYDARKRLYEQCEPILFQLAELSESALNHIFDLAKSAREGKLDSLSRVTYYSAWSLYNLIAPLAAFKLLRSRLTLVDLDLDEPIKVQYTIAKVLYQSFSEDHKLAEPDYTSQYNPLHASRERQGVYLGVIEATIDALLKPNSDGTRYILSFGEFQKDFFDLEHNILRNHQQNAIEKFHNLFSNFHPHKRPVLWRILILQAHLYNALLNINRTENSSRKSLDNFKVISITPKEDREQLFEWRQKNERDQISNDEVLIFPFVAVEKYLKDNLSDFLEVKINNVNYHHII
jgi:hypothetical protein